jgi:hypothetical protein
MNAEVHHVSRGARLCFSRPPSSVRPPSRSPPAAPTLGTLTSEAGALSSR